MGDKTIEYVQSFFMIVKSLFLKDWVERFLNGSQKDWINADLFPDCHGFAFKRSSSKILKCDIKQLSKCRVFLLIIKSSFLKDWAERFLKMCLCPSWELC